MNSSERARFLARIEAALPRALDYSAGLLAARARRLIRRGAEPAEASPPGEPPYSETGALRSSISTVPAARAVGKRGRVIEARVLASVPYAAHLELGTRHAAARPTLRAALRAARRLLRSQVARELRRALGLGR